MKRLPIFFAFDAGYVNPGAVAIFSLLNRARADVAYDIFVVHHDIPTDGQDLLRRVTSRFESATLTFVPTGDFLLDEWKSGAWGGFAPRFSPDTLMKCFGARFFPQYDRIVYSDADVLFVDDISELWDMPLNDAYLAGIRGVSLKSEQTSELCGLGHFSPENFARVRDSYVSGAIWVMDLATIRRDQLENRMLEIIRDPGITKLWPDQDVVNLVCGDRVAFIPLNYCGMSYLREMMDTKGFASHYSRDELFDSVLRPKILHYAGRKPWRERTPWESAWWNVAEYLQLGCSRAERPAPVSAEIDQELCRLRKQRRRYRISCAVLAIALTCLAIACALLVLVGL